MRMRKKSCNMQITVILLAMLWIGGDTQEPSLRCENGWTFFSEIFGFRNNGMCYLAVEAPMTVPEAEQYCDSRVSYLIDLDRIDQFSYFSSQQQSMTVPEFVFNNFHDFWSGMRVDSDDRLAWHAFGPKYVQRNRFEGRPWNWKPGQPTLNYTDTCGSVTLGKTDVIPDLPVTEIPTGPSYNGQITVGLDSCGKRLPFVCEKPAIQQNVAPSNTCPEGWVGNAYLPYCFRLVNETATLGGARRRCTDLGGHIATVTDPGFTSFNQTFVLRTYDWYIQNDPSFQEVSFRLLNEFWINTVSDGFSEIVSECYSFTFNDEVPGPRPTPCNATLYFMCTARLTKPVHPQITFTSPYFDQEELLTYPQWAQLSISFKVDRSPRNNEILFVNTPTTYLNSTNNYIDTQDFLYSVVPSNPTDEPSYVNVSLIQSPAALRKRRGLVRPTGIPEGGDFSTFVDFNNVIATTGYYGFGVYSIFPPSYKRTQPQLVRYSMSDLYIYVATVPVRDFLFGSEGGFTEQEVVLRKLLNDQSYGSILGEYLGSTLSGSGPRLPDNETPLFQYFGGTVEDVSLNPNMLKIRLFATPFSSRNLPVDTEQVFVPVLEDYLRTRLNSDAFVIESVNVRSTVSCPIRIFTQKATGAVYTLPTTMAGETGYSWERCVGGDGAYAKAVCEGGYDKGTSWGSIVYNTGCEPFPELNTSSSTKDLRNLSETVFTDDNVDVILRNTTKLTLPEIILTEADIIYTAEILYNYWKFESIVPINLIEVYNIMNNVLQALPDVISTAQELNNAANRIILAVDELTNNFELNSMQTLRFVRSFVASTVRYQTGRGDVVIGLELEDSASVQITNNSLLSVANASDVSFTNTDTAIYLPRDFVKGEPTRLSFHIYSKTELFATPGGRFKVNSKVAAARMEKRGRPVLELGDNRVTVVFSALEYSENAVCGYWDYFANEDAGGWRTEGCELRLNESKIICECDHLTNFAVLIDLEAYTIPEAHKAILAVITKVGLIISIIALAFTILTFLVFKHLRNGRGQQVLVNLSVAMLCSAVIFLVGMDRTESVAGCKVVAALLHYFILVSFAWMLVEGVLQYLRFVKVLGTYIPKFMMKSMIPAWGIPLLPVIIVLAVDHDLYYGGKGYCWLDKTAMLYAFIIPVAVVIFANLIVFTLVLANLCRRRNKGMKTNQSERKMAMLHFQAAVSIFVILGLTWVFGFMAVNEAQLVFHYLFAILNAFQGLFIFLLFTAREKQIRKAWKKVCCRKSAYKSTSTGSGADTNAGKKSSSDTNSTSGTGSSSTQFKNPNFSNE